MARGTGPLQDPGGRQEGLPGGDQEGVPQARAPVPPGHEQGRRGRGALQGDLRGLRRPRRPGEAQEVRPRRLRVRAAATRSAAAAAAAAPTRDRLRLVLGHPVGHLQHRRRARHAHEAGDRARQGPRDGGHAVLRAGDRGRAGARSRSPPTPRARPAAARGARPGTSPKVCPVCNGRGVEAQGQGVFSITRPCSRCNGSGTVIEDPCPTCAGEGRLREMKRYRVNIPAGVREGSRIRLAGKGEAGLRGGPPGDLYVVTHVDRVAGVQAQGRQLRGRGADHGRRGARRRRGRGPDAATAPRSCASRRAPSTARSSACAAKGRRSSSGSGRGDLHYRFVIEMPTTLTDEQKDAVEQLSKVMNGNPRERILRAAGRSR